MSNESTKRKQTLFRRLGARLGRRFGSRSTHGGSADAEDGESETPAVPEVWIVPKSSAAKQQTLLKKRRLSQSKLLIGRRGSIAELTESAMEDYLISQHEPYTVSKRQCLIEIRDGEVWLRDLKSRYGTVVNGRKIGGRNGTEKMEVRLRRGEHSLIPGPSASSFEFKIVVK